MLIGLDVQMKDAALVGTVSIWIGILSKSSNFLLLLPKTLAKKKSEALCPYPGPWLSCWTGPLSGAATS